MVIQPKIRGFICTTAHPKGCRQNVLNQIQYVQSQPKTEGARRALVIGCSTGYGLSSRITAAYSMGAATLGVMLEKNASGKRTATPGWYNTAAFEESAHSDNLYARTINGDAFSAEVKEQAIRAVKEDLGGVDLVVYSLAAPRRTDKDGNVWHSVLKTTGEDYTNKTVDLAKETVYEVTVPPASKEEIEATVKVMGGEDWADWMDALSDAGVLSEDTVTVAYSYLGPKLTYPMYHEGTIGKAKDHLYQTSIAIVEKHPNVRAYVSVNKGLVTQASAAIPIVPLYISILYKVMKEKGVHEGTIEQMYRLYHDMVYAEPQPTDDQGMFRPDNLEMREDVQRAVTHAWEKINTGNLRELADIDGYRQDFERMFGFGVDGVDYGADVDAEVPLPSEKTKE